VASDLFELDKTTYLLIANYFSRYVEVQTLTSTTSASIIRTLKAIFARHGIPETFTSDNGPQYVSQEMKDIA
jgi:alpha-D-ribose 1-methylphosphonate 5-phosphate C-P lyase